MYCRGMITNCAFANVRLEPDNDSYVMSVLHRGDLVTIDLDKTNADWVCVITEHDITGFVARKFVDYKKPSPPVEKVESKKDDRTKRDSSDDGYNKSDSGRTITVDYTAPGTRGNGRSHKHSKNR